MGVRKLIIEPDDIIETKSKKTNAKIRKGKSRQFEAQLLSYITAKDMWDGGSVKTDNVRPVLFMCGATESQMKAFYANLRSGRMAKLIEIHNEYRISEIDKFEIMKKSAEYRWCFQRISGVDGTNGESMVVLTVYMPELFQVKPIYIDPDRVSFINIAPKWWVDRQLAELQMQPNICRDIIDYAKHLNWQNEYGFTDEDILRAVPQAAYFIAYLRERTGLALINGLEFQVHLFLKGLRNGLSRICLDNRPDKWKWASYVESYTFKAYNTNEVGFEFAVRCSVKQSALAEFITECSLEYKIVQDKLDVQYPERRLEREERKVEQRERIFKMLDSARNSSFVKGQYDKDFTILNEEEVLELTGEMEEEAFNGEVLEGQVIQPGEETVKHHIPKNNTTTEIENYEPIVITKPSVTKLSIPVTAEFLDHLYDRNQNQEVLERQLRVKPEKKKVVKKPSTRPSISDEDFIPNLLKQMALDFGAGSSAPVVVKIDTKNKRQAVYAPEAAAYNEKVLKARN